jgi:hypothetical protein
MIWGMPDFYCCAGTKVAAVRPASQESNLNDCDFKVTILGARNSGIPRTS